MLEQVRNRMQSGYTYVLIAFLIVIFMFFFGMPTRGCGKSVGPGQVELATYDGETVYNTDVSLIYNRFFGDQQGRDKQKFYRQQARSLRSYLLVKLFADRARQAGLRVGPKEFKTYMTDPMRNIEFRYFYGRDGKWNGKYYQAYVRNQLRTQIEDYEKFKREELLARKYLALHNLSVAPFPQELSDTHAFKNTKINLSYVALDPASLRQKVEVTDEEISSFRKKSADEIQSYYKKHSKEYQKPAKVRIRRVYIPRSGDGGDAESRWKQAKKRVLENNEKLGAVAADLGESYPGQKRGLMDWSTLDNLNQDIAKAIEGADVGAVEKVVTDHAYMLVKVEDRKKAATTPLKKAAPEIAEKLLRKQRAEAFVDGAADKLLKAARNSDSLDAALKKLGSSDEKLWSALSVSTTGDFTLETTNMGARLRGRLSGMNFGGSWAKIPGIGKSKELSTLAYSELSADNPVPNKTFEVGGAVHVVRLKSKKKPEDKSGLEMRVKQQLEKTSDIIGSWNGIFQMPAEEYGPWIKKQFQAAVASGKITLATKNSQTAKLLANDFKPVGNKGKKGKGRTIKLSPGKGKKGKGRTIKLSPGKGKKGGGKKIKLNPGGGKKGGDDEGGGKKIKLKMGGSNKKGGE